jgi:hypothetical protein
MSRSETEMPANAGKTLADMVKNNKLLLHKYCSEFYEYFKMPLKDFIEPFFGFDIIKFNERINTPDNVSTQEYITNKYGTKATKLIENLL